jgi:hypothetical protein
MEGIRRYDKMGHNYTCEETRARLMENVTFFL